eukprot:jgi/Orpsp1_1/1184276/evm.model.c7180000088876.1
MYQNRNIYEDPSQYMSPTQQQPPPPPQSQPSNSYTIDIAPSFGVENQQRTIQPTYNSYSLSPLQQQLPPPQQQSLSPLSYTTSPGITSPGLASPGSNYVYQGSTTAYQNLYNTSPTNGQLPMAQSGLYQMAPSPMDPTTPRFSVPLPEHMQNLSPGGIQKPMGYGGLPMSPQSAINQSYPSPSPYNMTQQPYSPNPIGAQVPIMAPPPNQAQPAAPAPTAQPNFNPPTQYYNLY